MLHEKVAVYKEDYSLENDSIAFSWLVLETTLHLNSEEIEDSLTDGSMDGGIDAIYIFERAVHIFTFKYTSTFEHTKNNFPETDLDKLSSTMRAIFEKTLTREMVNELVWEKTNEIWESYKKGPLTFKYYVCSNKQKPVEHAKKKFEGAIKDRFVEVNYIDQEDLVNKILERRYRHVNGQLTFIDKQYFERTDRNLKGIVATVAATDLIELVTDPDTPDQINEDAFNDNVRIYQQGNRINQHIIETALGEENHTFWYLNNGITIICEEAIYSPNVRSPRVNLNNFQIVNGGQTTHALFEAFQADKEAIENVLLLVRICETQRDNPIAEKISETTNSQTQVTTRDLHANDRIQRKLEDEFRSLGYFYERKQNQYVNEPISKRLNNELLGQLYLAFYLDMPSEAKNSKNIVFDTKYDEIFNEETLTASSMLLPLRLFLPLQSMKREIQKRKRRREPINETDAFVSRATFHILNVIRLISEKELVDLSNENLDIEPITNKSIQLLQELVSQEMQKRGSVYTHDKLFKEVKTNELIRNLIRQKYPDSD